MKSKILVLVRHAHRDTSDREMDNGLTKKGEKQAKAVAHLIASRLEDWNSAPALLSSPKKRCIETLAPAAKAIGLEVQIHKDLDECRRGESIETFVQRVESFLAWWIQDGPEICLVSSHGDWLPVALNHLVGQSLSMKKGAYVEIDWAGAAQLKWMIPKPAQIL